MKALVIYDSVFGNTEKVAQAIAAGLDSPALPVGQATGNRSAGWNCWLSARPRAVFDLLRRSRNS